MNKKNMPTIALATGGTGGHVFPAQALAEELVSRGHKVLIICDQRTDTLLKLKSSKLEILKIVAPQPTNNPIKMAINLVRLLPTISRLRKYFIVHSVACVVGFGGYPTVPSLLGALFARKKLYLHEQNTVLGRVNRIFARFVNRIFLSFPKTQKIPLPYQKKAEVVGNLVRKEVIKAYSNVHSDESDTIKILAIGGSQGAKIIADVVPKAIVNLPKPLQKKIVLYQQIRKGMQDSVESALDKSHLKEYHVAQFFENIGDIMSEADLIISRSGASIITEIMIMGKPSILIPYKFATDDHQTINAKYLVKNNAGVMISEEILTPDVLAYKIQNFLKNPSKLDKLSENAKALAIVNAAAKVADYIEGDIWPEK